MKNTIITFFLLSYFNFCLAEPGQIDKSAMVTVVTITSANRNGAWLKWACETYQAWNQASGSLWSGTDTKKENLGSGLCAGYIAGVIDRVNTDTCLSKQNMNPTLVLSYLATHPELSATPASQLVIEAYQANCK